MSYDRELAEQFARKTYTGAEGSIDYRIRMPESGTKKPPLVLFLHGAGERGGDNEKQLALALLPAFTVEKELYRSVVIAPQCPEEKYWADYTHPDFFYSVDGTPETPQLKLVYKLVSDTVAAGTVDKDRVYIFGLSMGGFGTWDMLTRHGDLFAAGIPICGGGDPTKAEQLADIPIYTFHGTADPVVPVRCTEEMVRAIGKFGKGKIRYVAFEGGGHGIWDRAVAYAGDEENPPTLKWLFSQRKGSR